MHNTCKSISVSPSKQDSSSCLTTVQAFASLWRSFVTRFESALNSLSKATCCSNAATSFRTSAAYFTAPDTKNDGHAASRRRPGSALQCQHEFFMKVNFYSIRKRLEKALQLSWCCLSLTSPASSMTASRKNSSVMACFSTLFMFESGASE